jgi:hypothetical protein
MRRTGVASRINLKHDLETREKIQTSQLINRLQSFVNEEVTIDPVRLKAIEILLRKSLPDLSSVSVEGPGANGEHIVGVRWMNSPDEKL